MISADRAVLLVLLTAIAALAWWWLAANSAMPTATDMPVMGPGSGMAAAPPVASLAYVGSAFLMWSLMMVAMMLPSALPMILLFSRMTRQGGDSGRILRSLVFAASYVAIWIAFSVAAALVQTLLVAAQMVPAVTLALGDRTLAAGLLLLAAAYQITPLKRACLDRCRSPLSFAMRLWRPGPWGAWRLGLAHGLYCVGCCWLLMLLLFLFGVMNLAWVAALAILVAMEKLTPRALRFDRVLAVGFLAGAVVLLVP
jgi:predicted metal-binding membrane protein